MTWDDCVYQFLETGWFDFEDRVKTVAAMGNLIEQVPDEVFDEISVLVFAPSQHLRGQVYPGSGIAKAIIYLSPALEEQPQEEVDFTVAHEFAHAILEHQGWVTNGPGIEDEADALAVKWGFVRPERRKRKVEGEGR